MIEKLPELNFSGDGLLLHSSDLEDLLGPDEPATQANSEHPIIPDRHENQQEQSIEITEVEQVAPLSLHQAYLGELTKALNELKKDKEHFDINSQDHEGDTALTICAILLCRHFKAEGFNFGQERSDGVKLLINIIRELLKRKADVNVVNHQGDTFFELLIRSCYVSIQHPHVNINAVMESILTNSFINARDTDISPILYALGKIFKKDKDGLISNDGRTQVFELAFCQIVNRIIGVANRSPCQYNESFVYRNETQTLKQIYTEIGYGDRLPVQRSQGQQEPSVPSLFFPPAGIKRRRMGSEITGNPKKVREVSLSP